MVEETNEEPDDQGINAFMNDDIPKYLDIVDLL